ncbi:MAG: hypothetical protein WBP58_15495 [Chitinophagaceae bacterium]
MKFEQLVPNIFYARLPMAFVFLWTVLGLRFCMMRLLRHNPEFRLVTENIEEVYAKVWASHPEFLHPNLSKITRSPWGAKEFALTDGQFGGSDTAVVNK